MVEENSDRTTGGETHTFKPADYFLGILQDIVKNNKSTRVVLPGQGEVIVFPESGEYYTNVEDMAAFCQASATQFEITPWGNASLSYPSNTRKNIKELLWAAGFHVSRGRLPEGSTKYDVIQFRHWPNLTRVPVTPNAAHICALLTRAPTTIMLVRRILDITQDEVYQIYSAANSAGLTIKVNKTAESEKIETQMINAPPPPAHGLFRSLFTKILGL